MELTSVLIDFHGVLTDGRQTITHDGKYFFDHVHTRDVRAIRELVARGFYVAIVTASSSTIISHFAGRLKIDVIVARDKSKVISQFEHYAAVGDDAWDVKMLAKADQAFCPSDADQSLKILPNVHILGTEGGRGVIAEMLPFLIKR